MSNTIRITSAGNFYANSFDEVTFNANTIYGTNYVPNSQNFSGWNGPGNTYSISNTVPAPDGTFTATLAIPTTTNNYKGLSYGITFNSAGTLSVYVKPSGAYTFFSLSNDPNNTTFFNLAAGTTSGPGLGWNSSSITAYPNGWYRLSVTQTSTQNWGTLHIQLENNSQSYTFAGDGVSGYYIWGVQLEKNLTPTIYKPTNASGLPLYNTVQKIDSNGNNYITGQFDEVSGSSVTDGLTFYLDAKIYDSSTYSRNTWLDLSPKNVRVTLKNVGYNSANGGYFTFQGNSTTDYYINTNLTESSFISPSAGTISVWFLPTGASPNMGGSSYAGQHIWGETDIFGSGGGDDYIWIVRGIRNGVDAIYCGLWENANEHFVSVPYTANQWINITWLHTNNTLYAYSNGQLVGSVTANNSSSASCTTIIGGCPGHNSGLSGYIGKVQSYNRALSPTEIQINYNADAARFNLTPIGPQAVQRILPTGNTYITGIYDEWTGIVSTTNGLVTYLDAAVPASTTGSQTQWNDISGSGYGINATYQTNNLFSQYNSSLQAYDFYLPAQGFQFIPSNTSYMRTPTFTMEIWVRHTKFNDNGAFGNYYTVFELYGSSGFRFGTNTPNGLSTDTTGAPVFWTNQTGGNFGSPVTTYPILLNTWYQIVVTYDGSTCNVYLNGTLYSTKTNAVYITPTSTNFYIGGSDEGIKSWNGQMSIFRWYSRSLSASEVQANFNGNRNRYGI